MCANAKGLSRWSGENEPVMPGRPEMSEVELEMERMGLLRDFLLLTIRPCKQLQIKPLFVSTQSLAHTEAKDWSK